MHRTSLNHVTQWFENRFSPRDPSVVAIILVVLGLLVAACGNGNNGGSGY